MLGRDCSPRNCRPPLCGTFSPSNLSVRVVVTNSHTSTSDYNTLRTAISGPSVAALDRDFQAESLSTLPQRWNTENLEDDFKQHASQTRNRALRRTPKQRVGRKERGRIPRGSNVLDVRSWGIKRGAYLARHEQQMLARKYQRWQLLRDKGAALASELGRQASQAQLAEATGYPESEITAVLKDGPIAADLILESVASLLRKICRSYLRQGWEFEDMLLEAQGLWLEAVLLYDPERAALNSFAVMYLRQQLPLQMEVLNSTLHRSPVAAKDDQRIARIQMDLLEVLKREPTAEEIAIKLGKPLVRVANLIRQRKSIVSTEKTVFRQEGKPGEPQTIGEALEETSNLGEGEDPHLLPSLRTELAYGMEAALNATIEDDRDKQIFLLYYQLVETEQPMHLKQIGKMLGISHETVRTRLRSVLEKFQSDNNLRQRLEMYHTPEILDY